MSEAESDRAALIEQIERQEGQLARISAERREAEARLATLRRQLADLDVSRGRDSLRPTPSSPSEKIALFRSLFRGRADVFPTHWSNPRTRKSGYSPACSNEWVPGLCEKPRVKCGECPNQAFLTVTDSVVRDHLQGRHVIGVYPLLQDEKCWFLAVDFDKDGWQSDVHAFRETCDDLGVHAAVERSRSGNGAHVWFFFAEPMLAVDARRMGSYLITETMKRRHYLSFGSYDRLFPNQDTMPRGGFGNLIALPLQREARDRDDTVLVDAEWRPYDDQWAYLASVPRLDAATVEKLVGRAAASGGSIGLPMGDDAEEDAEAPWKRQTSTGRTSLASVEGLPKRIRVVLAGRLYVEKEGVPSPLLNAIKRLAAFQNPEFYKRQSMRLSTALTPRVIGCAEDIDGKAIAFPGAALQAAGGQSNFN